VPNAVVNCLPCRHCRPHLLPCFSPCPFTLPPRPALSPACPLALLLHPASSPRLRSYTRQDEAKRNIAPEMNRSWKIVNPTKHNRYGGQTGYKVRRTPTHVLFHSNALTPARANSTKATFIHCPTHIHTFVHSYTALHTYTHSFIHTLPYTHTHIRSFIHCPTHIHTFVHSYTALHTHT
jgi:hypothetical protein